MKRRLQILFSISIALFLIAGCSLPPAPAPTNGGTSQVSGHGNQATTDPNAPATPTPFQPGGDTSATSAPQQTGTADLGQTDGPVPQSGTPTKTPYLNRYTKPDGQVNILILGSDFRPNAGYRTDVMLLLSVNTKQGTASVVSFPRDLYIDIPGWEMQRINTAQAHGGFALTQATFEENFGVHPDHYVMTNFQGFKGIIDTLGGIDVYASKSLSDTCDLPQKVKGYCSVNPGWVHMDAATALWYVRARHTTSDYDRNRREQEVIQAIFTKLLSLNALTRAPELYNMFKSSVETDMNLTDVLALLPVAQKFTDLKDLKRYAVDQTLASGWITPEGADVQVPNLDLIFTNIIAKACYGQ
jgi:polyisoprenyl-teichoic acid--peptidoglycan teichoic acid transferase